MKIRRVVSLIVCVSMIAAMLMSSCIKETSSDLTGSGDASGLETPAPGETTTEFSRSTTPDSLPEDLNFNGEIFTILSRSESFFGVEMGVDEEKQEIVNDTILRRNKNVEDRLNVVIDIIRIPGNAGYEASFMNEITKSVTAGDNAFDLIAGYAYHMASLAPGGAFYNLNKVPHLDFDAPWWTKDLAEQLNLDGKLYFMCGDLGLTAIQSMLVMFFNKRMQNEYRVEDIYKLVESGGWTFDKLSNISKEIYKDINGNTLKDNEDIYGGAFERGNHNDALFTGMNQQYVQKNADGELELVMNTERTTSVIEKINDLFFENPGVITMPEALETPTRAMFVNGQTLFYMGGLQYAELIRDMEDDFGIIPFPKYDETQAEYHTLTQAAHTMFSIPSTNERLELVGAVTEAMAAESYRILTPAYYETALKIKYSRDDDTSRMLDIIRDSVTFDFGYTNGGNLNNFIFLFRDLTDRKKNNFVSAYEAAENGYKTRLQTLVDAYKALPA